MESGRRGLGGGRALSCWVQGAVRADIEPAGSADDFVDRIGFCTHWGYTDTPYGTAYEQVKALLGEMGVAMCATAGRQREAGSLHHSLGIKTTLVFGPGIEPTQAVTFLQTASRPGRDGRGAERSRSLRTSANYKGQGFPEGPRLYTQELYAALKADPADGGGGDHRALGRPRGC